MEVHAHTHTAPDFHRDKRKKWTHYFWEFLMLFLAVFCGFLAEYQLEHKIEKDREKQYIISLIEDLKVDSMMLHNAVNDNLPRAIAKTDTLINYLLSDNPAAYASNIYFLSHWVRRRFFHEFQDRTIVQLRNAGGLRLITSHKVKDSINLYYRRIEILEKFDEGIADNSREMKSFFPKIFFVKDIQEMFDPVTDYLSQSPGKLKLRSTDPELMNELALYLHNYRSMETQYLRRAKALSQRLPNIISMIKKEYHLN